MGERQNRALRREKDFMNKAKRLVGTIGFVLCTALLGALTGYTTCGQPSVSVGVSVSLPSVEIRAVSDFYEPLASARGMGGYRVLRPLLETAQR